MMSKSGPNILMILAVLIACAIIAGAIIMVGTSSDEIIGSGSAAQTGLVEVPQGMQACATGDSCIVVDRHCGLCCDYLPINSRHEALFDEMFRNDCRGFRGQSCSCFDLSSYPSCEDGRCILIDWPE